MRLAETPQPLLHDVNATIRVDIHHDGEERPWHLTIHQGQVSVSRSDAPADAVMRTDRALWDSVVSGDANVLTAALRGRLRIEGDVRLLMAFRRLLPGPPQHRTLVPTPISGKEYAK
jgi:putative sterol carrier protein